jgi:two-component system chemotaxis response regulator CheY
MEDRMLDRRLLGATVLLVDDADQVRSLCKQVLAPHGCTVVEAENGQAAVAAYQQHHPDVVVMDIAMPVMDGLSALKAIMAVDPNARVMMVTAMGQGEHVRAAIEAGARDFIVKPFGSSRFLAGIHKLLAEARAD